MFAIQCSFCQHENVPGARFCAECGSPLHLKVCPNPKCGKVSDVSASRCETCNTPFPKIALAPPEVATSENSPVGGVDAPGGARKDVLPAKKQLRAVGPLIMVALVAGGLPFLWFNRSLLPMPKTWQTISEGVKIAEPPRPAIPAPTARPAQPPAPAVTAADPAPASPPPASATPAAAETPAASAASPQKAATKLTTREKAKAKRNKAHANIAAKPPATEVAPPPRPCTEAVDALGLCGPKQTKQ